MKKDKNESKNIDISSKSYSLRDLAGYSLPHIKQIYVEGKLFKEFQEDIEVGLKSSSRVRCSSCLKEHTIHTQYIDKGNGFGGWVTNSSKHC